jgi:hypothetical protein
MAQISWPKNVRVLNFAAASTTPAEGAINLNGVGAITLICDADFNTDVLTLKSSVTGDTGFTLTAATGQNRLTSEQQLAISTMPDVLITTNTATAGAAVIRVMMLGG